MRRALVSVAFTVGCLAFVSWMELEFVPLGFNPTDDGYIVSQARRLLDGDLPHADLISPRPLGSAFLHIVDVVLPIPLYEATRLIFVAQMILMSALFAWFVLDRPPWRWHPLEAIGTAASVLVNIHVFPLMPWHTTDGLTALAAGLVVTGAALERRSRLLLAMGFALLGAAPVMKQSFVFAPVIGAVWAVTSWRRRTAQNAPPWRDRDTMVDAAVAVGAAAVPGLLYVVAVALAGGTGTMIDQLTGAARLTSYPIVDQFRVEPGQRQLTVLLGRLLAALVAARACEVIGRRYRVVGLAALVPLSLAVVVAFRVVVSEDLTYGSMWGAKLTWALGAIVIGEALLWGRLDGRGAVVFGAGLMSSLSWGYAIPNLIAGTTALTLIQRLGMHAAPVLQRRLRLLVVPAAAAAAAALASLVLVFDDARRNIVYFDHPEAALTATLADVDRDFGRLRSTPTVHRYLDDLAGCIRRHPAGRVAVLPDNPGLYAVFDLDNPLPLDWTFPPEFVGAEAKLVASARAAARDRDFLVLFQTFSAFDLRTQTNYPDAAAGTPPYTYGDRTLTRVADTFATAPGARRVECGGFVGFYAPAGSASRGG